MKERKLPTPERNQVCAPPNQSILKFYENIFETVYIILHPFLKIENSDKIDFEKEQYPTKSEIILHCSEMSWSKFLTISGIESISKLDIALRNSIGGLKKSHKDLNSLNQLYETCEKYNLVSPVEGDFPEILLNKMLKSFQKLDYKWIFLGDEFGVERKLVFIEDIIQSKTEISSNINNLFTNDNKILFSVHWDSHFTLLCSNKLNAKQIISESKFEGFYCNELTEMYWSVK